MKDLNENGEKTFNLAPTEAPVDAKQSDISGQSLDQTRLDQTRPD